MTSNPWNRIVANVDSSTWTGIPLESTQAPSMAAKRLLDLTVSVVGLVVLAPVLLMIALGVKLDSAGPALYISRRLGRNGREFYCLKFRTMMRDGRVTSFGSLLRRYGLDELPQLLNVLRGHMSLVGPRPVIASECPRGSVCRFRRFEMKPGITGLWAAQEGEYPPFSSYVSMDDTYRRNWSIRLDMMIVVRSVGAALAGRGH